MKLLLLLAGLLIQQSAVACETPELRHFLVYAIEGLTADSTEYQGLVGSAGNITLTNVRVGGNQETCLALSSGKGIAVSDACLGQGIEAAREVLLQRVCSVAGSGSQGRTSADHRKLPREIRELSARFARATPGGITISHRNGWRFLESDRPLAVLNADESFFGPNNRTVITGAPSQLIVINVSGRHVNINDARIYAENISPSQIIFHFPDAEELTIRHTGNAGDSLPGTILAPRAAFTFVDSFITGQVLVRRIEAPARGERSGQVNAVAPAPRPGKKPDGKK